MKIHKVTPIIETFQTELDQNDNEIEIKLTTDYKVEEIFLENTSAIELSNLQAIANLRIQSMFVRNKRNELLNESDKFVQPDRWEIMDTETKASISEYRQLLRDIPQQKSFPFDIVWPQIPVLF